MDGDTDRVKLEIGTSGRATVALEREITKRIYGCQRAIGSLLLIHTLDISPRNQSANGILFLTLITARHLERTARSTHVT